MPCSLLTRWWCRVQVADLRDMLIDLDAEPTDAELEQMIAEHDVNHGPTQLLAVSHMWHF